MVVKFSVYLNKGVSVMGGWVHRSEGTFSDVAVLRASTVTDASLSINIARSGAYTQQMTAFRIQTKLCWLFISGNINSTARWDLNFGIILTYCIYTKEIKKLLITHSLTKHFYFDSIENSSMKENRNIIELVYK